MNLRWLFGNFSDPQYRLSRADQRRLVRNAHKQYLSARNLTVMTLVLVVVMVLGFRLVHPLLEALLSRIGGRGVAVSGTGWAWVLGAVIWIIFVWIASAWAYRFIYIRPIRRAMRDEGYILCIACGYDLRGQPDEGDRCPECGARRELMRSDDSSEPETDRRA